MGTVPDARAIAVSLCFRRFPESHLDLDGKLLGWLGGSGKTLKMFGWFPESACPVEDELYVAEILNGRAQKLTLYP